MRTQLTDRGDQMVLNPKYINIHSHSSTNEAKVLTVRSLFHNQAPNDFDASFFSIGVHPWHIKSCDIQHALKQVAELSVNNRVIAIGEVGLDRSIETEIDLQKEILKQHLDIAEACNKPLIIHCVRAFPELIQTLKASSVPVIIHGFRGNIQTVTELVRHGFYISLGAAIIDCPPKLGKAVAGIPLNQLFFETDESESSVKEIYEAAAGITSVCEPELCSQIYRNFKTVFCL